MTKIWKIGTRGSQLATTQAATVRDALRAAGHLAELVIVTTHGDVNMAPVERIGVGVFTSALREALRSGEVDIAVHSYKDLPTAPEPDLTLAATPPREHPADVLVMARETPAGDATDLPLPELPHGATVGTGAPRRFSQLRALRPDLDIRPLRGNINRRLGTVDSGELAGVILARAGLERVGLADRVTHSFTPEEMLPAPAQGILAVECRSADAELADLLRSVLDDPTARAAALAERRVLADLEAGCTAPVGALATVAKDSTLTVTGVAAALDGSTILRATATGSATTASDLGASVAAELLARGATKLMERSAAT